MKKTKEKERGNAPRQKIRIGRFDQKRKDEGAKENESESAKNQKTALFLENHPQLLLFAISIIPQDKAERSHAFVTSEVTGKAGFRRIIFGTIGLS